MQALVKLTGVAAPLFEDDIDTDQLCPKQHLTRLERQGFADTLFSDRRYAEDGALRTDFVLNQEAWRDASILIGGSNFGCGSSREHAVWALADYGIRCVIAPSFGDIFFQNCVNGGLLAIKLPTATVARLADIALVQPGAAWTVDLSAKTIAVPDGSVVFFEVDPVSRMRLLEGLDEIGLTLKHQQTIAAFEQRQRVAEPWLW